MHPPDSRYELMRRFVRGDSADVFLARRHGAAGFIRPCVVKRLRADSVLGPERVDRFLRAARTTALIQQRNIPQVIDLGQLDGSHFVALELVDGPDLEAIQRRADKKDAPLAPDVAAWMIQQATCGLAFIHELSDPVSGDELGLVHGRLGATDIVASRHGTIHLLGFGRGPTDAPPLTDATRRYAAPEVVSGNLPDVRSDVYAVAAVLYHLLTGNCPQAGTVIPPSRAGGPPDAWLDKVVMSALASDPAERPATAQELADGLGKWLFRRTADARQRLSSWIAHNAEDLCPAQRSDSDEPGGESNDVVAPITWQDRAQVSNVQVPPETMVGGSRVVDRIEEHLGGGHRLVCVRGTAGIGKSRAVHEAAWRHVERGATAWRVDLHDVEDVATACAEIAVAIGSSLSGARSADEAVAAVGDLLSSADNALLVLDGMDLLVDAAAKMIAPWLVAAPSLRVLATSRRRLAVPGATGVVVQPLGGPSDDDKRPLSAPGCQLFVRRALPLLGKSTLTASERTAVRAIVSRLDGIPLAIELAATRLADMQLDALATRLQTGLGVIEKGRKGRRHTLRGAIGWSWTLLRAWERSTLIQVSVFRGGFTAECARDVVVLSDSEGATVDDVIGELRDRSLLRALDADGRDQRFGLFDSIRAYVAEQDGADDLIAAATRRHAAAILKRSREVRQHCQTHKGDRADRWLLAERDNLVAVHQRALAARPLTAANVTNALEVPYLLYPALIERGPQGLLLDLFGLASRAADTLGEDEAAAIDPALYARSLALFADMIGNTGRALDGVALAERARELAESADDTGALALAHYGRAICLRLSDRMDESVAAASKARELCQRVGNLWLEAQALNVLGGVFYDKGEREQSAGCFHASLAAARQVGHHLQVSRTTGNLGCIYADRGDMERAAPYFHESLRDARSRHNRRGEGVIHSYLGIVAQERGDFGLAAMHYNRGLRLLAGVGDRHRRSYVDGLRAQLLAEQSRLDQAEEVLRAIMDEFVGRGDWRLRSMYLATVAFIRAVRGDQDTAKRLIGMSEKLAGQQSDPSPRGVLKVFAAGVVLLDSASSAAIRTGARRDLQGVQVRGPASPAHPDGVPPLTWLSSEVRTALRILSANGVSADTPRRQGNAAQGAPS